MIRKLAFAAACAGLVAGAAFAQEMKTDIVGEKGQTVGSVELKQGPHGLVARIALNPGSLTPGWHGVHIHEHGDCSDHGEFLKSKGHVNPDGLEHGFLNPKGPHPSDLPNIWAHADGSSQSEMLVPGVSLTGGEINLADGDGSAIVIHADPDDHLTQPIGGAGARVACAVIK